MAKKKRKFVVWNQIVLEIKKENSSRHPCNGCFFDNNRCADNRCASSSTIIDDYAHHCSYDETIYVKAGKIFKSKK